MTAEGIIRLLLLFHLHGREHQQVMQLQLGIVLYLSSSMAADGRSGEPSVALPVNTNKCYYYLQLALALFLPNKSTMEAGGGMYLLLLSHDVCSSNNKCA